MSGVLVGTSDSESAHTERVIVIFLGLLRFGSLAFGLVAALTAAEVRGAALGLWVGFGCTVALASTYFAFVGLPVHVSTAVGQDEAANALINAVSYLAFWAVGFVGFRLFRQVADQVAVLQELIARIAAERARIL